MVDHQKKEVIEMVDTVRGGFAGKVCSDCGELGCVFVHNGPLVPKGETGSFCAFCWQERNKCFEKGETQKPLGVKPPGVPEGFSNAPIKVITKNGSIYEFSEPNKRGERKVSCASKTFEFTTCRIICLRVGRELYFKSLDSTDPDDLYGWITSPVVSIE